MATVTLDRLWIHVATDVTDLSVYERFYTSDWGNSRAMPGEVRRYSSGRLRPVTRVGKARTFKRTLRNVTEAQLELLDEWMGLDLMVRDHHHRIMFGTYFDFGEADYKDGAGYDVPLTFQEITVSVAV